jgi:hypothetical protein
MLTTIQPKESLTEAQMHYHRDRPRLRTRKRALLDLLRDGYWHPNYELVKAGGLSFNSYLYQLRNEGWQIESRRVRGGVWERRLVGRGSPRPRRGLSRPQQRVADELAVAVRKIYGHEGLERISREFSPWLRSASRRIRPISGASDDD